MVKIVVSAWVIWFIYIILLETAVPEVLYQALEGVTMISMMIIPIGGHVLTFQAIRSNNKKILNKTHNSQQAILFKREKKAFTDMALYTVATLLSILPVLLLLNVEKSIVSGHILFPWASVFSQLISSLNPVVQIKKKYRFEAGFEVGNVKSSFFCSVVCLFVFLRGTINFAR